MQERTELSVHDQLRDVRAIGTLSFTNRVRPASDMSADAHNERSQSPEKKVHAWIIGSDIAPLAAAVYLLEDAQLPAENIHLLNIHRSCGMEVQGSGDPEHGYVLRTGELPFFHDDCVDKLLSRVSSPEIPPNPSPKIVQESDGRLQKHCMKVARLLKTRCLGKHPKRITLDNCHGNLKHRCELLRLALSSESSIEGKSIKDVFCPSFFDSNIWKVWSTTFRLQSHHRALEFRHQLYNYGDNLNGFNLVGTLDRGQYTINESIVVPITDFLRNKGVDMNNPEVIDLSMTSDNNPAAVSGIEAIQDDTMKSIAIHKSDIVIVSLGSMSLGTVIGSNISPPSPLRLDEIKIGDWSLWIKLSQRSVQYGEPLAFSTKVNETKLESFTMTFRNSTFLDPYQRLTHDHPGSGRLVSLVDSSWMLSISLPQCPIFPDQPKDVNVIWGYGLYPDRIGDFVRKPMLKCSGQEILLELLQHLRFSLDQIVPYASTIPMIRPLATASSVNQLPHHRPSVAPGITTNLAFVGPFTDFPWKAACSVEYSIRSAQYAAHTMMGIAEKPLPTRKNFLSTAWGFLR